MSKDYNWQGSGRISLDAGGGMCFLILKFVWDFFPIPTTSSPHHHTAGCPTVQFSSDAHYPPRTSVRRRGLAAAPSHAGTRDRFRERQFFQRPGRGMCT